MEKTDRKDFEKENPTKEFIEIFKGLHEHMRSTATAITSLTKEINENAVLIAGMRGEFSFLRENVNLLLKSVHDASADSVLSRLSAIENSLNSLNVTGSVQRLAVLETTLDAIKKEIERIDEIQKDIVEEDGRKSHARWQTIAAVATAIVTAVAGLISTALAYLMGSSGNK